MKTTSIIVSFVLILAPSFAFASFDQNLSDMVQISCTDSDMDINLEILSLNEKNLTIKSDLYSGSFQKYTPQ